MNDDQKQKLRQQIANLTNSGNWRVGKTVGRTIYKGDGPDDLIGVMDTRKDAEFVAAAPGIILDLLKELDQC